MLKVLVAVGTLIIIASSPSCSNAPKSPIPKFEMGDGRWVVGEDIAPGTYQAANALKHTSKTPCKWVATKRTSNGSKVVDLRSGNTDNQVQKVYVAGGDVFEVHNCGKWARISPNNVT